VTDLKRFEPYQFLWNVKAHDLEAKVQQFSAIASSANVICIVGFSHTRVLLQAVPADLLGKCAKLIWAKAKFAQDVTSTFVQGMMSNCTKIVVV
jgi:hypothetical protein